MKALLVTLSLLIFGEFAQAVPVAINRRDVKFPSQQMVEKQEFTNPIASNSTYVSSAAAGNTSAAAATLSSFSNQPDVPRNIEIGPTTSTVDVAACTITVSGTDFFGDSISEEYVFTNDQSTKVVGNRAFKTVSSVSFPANCEDGAFAAQWQIGVGEKLGAKRCMANAGDIFHSLLNGAKEATAPSMAVHASQVSSNTADFNGTMNGSNDFVLYFMQNFGCFP